MNPFMPVDVTRVFATPGVASSAAQALGGVTSGVGSVRIVNGTNQVIGVTFGLTGVVATMTTGTSFVAVLPSASVIVRVPLGVTHAAVIAAAAATGSAYLTPGEGG